MSDDRSPGSHNTVSSAPAGRPRAFRRPRRAGIPTLALGLAVALGGCTAAGGGTDAAAATSSSSSSSAGGTAVALENAYQHVINRVLPSVVEIRTSVGLGSGVVYDDKGDIVTNAHVVGSSRQFQVLTSGSATPRQATLVGVYQPNDLAVIRVQDTKGLKPAAFADSSKAKVGDIVLAMGNPLGLSATVTNGIISALGRTVSEPANQQEGLPGATLPSTIQTSAAINPGNSGGALVGLDAKVVGIPTLAATEPQANGVAPGIGFAIPSNTVKRIAGQLVKSGKVSNSGRAALGVRVTTVANQAGQPQGVGVVDVQQGGAAAKAGIQPGDIIVSVDGQQTPTVQQLGAVLAGLHVGQQVPVTVMRNGQQKKLQVTLGQLGG